VEKSSPLEPVALERFVDAQVVAEFIAVRRPEVLKLTREGKLGAMLTGAVSATYTVIA
jgi:hypothetical protein